MMIINKSTCTCTQKSQMYHKTVTHCNYNGLLGARSRWHWHSTWPEGRPVKLTWLVQLLLLTIDKG